MSITDIQWARLPTELVLEVFRHAAASSKSNSLTLSLVASWVRDHVEPLLYHTVILSTTPSLLAFLSAISRKPSFFPTKYVKNLGIFALGPLQAISSILNVCGRVDALALSTSLPCFRNWQTDLMASQKITLGTICPKEQHFLGSSFRDTWDPLLIGPETTHLRIHISSHSPSSPFHMSFTQSDSLPTAWVDICRFPRLSRLAIVFRPTTSTNISTTFTSLQRICQSRIDSSSPPFHLLLVQVVGLPKVQNQVAALLNSLALSAGGPSLCIVAEAASVSAIAQWEHAVSEGKSIWDTAERVAEGRAAQGGPL